MIEGYNRRLKRIFPRDRPALDVMVDKLAEEDTYWRNTIKDSRLSGLRPVKTAALATTTSTSAPIPVTQSKFDRHQACRGKQRIINQDCMLEICAQCCNAKPQTCRAHNRTKKIGATKPYLQTSLAGSTPPPPPIAEKGQKSDADILPGIREKVTSTVNNRGHMYILYKAGTEPRKVHPLKIIPGKNGYCKVECYCDLRKAKRSFFLYDILEIRDFKWTVGIIPPSYL
jgi:hypothetical protein